MTSNQIKMLAAIPDQLNSTPEFNNLFLYVQNSLLFLNILGYWRIISVLIQRL